MSESPYEQRPLPIHLQEDSLKRIVKENEGDNVQVEKISVNQGIGQGENYGSSFYTIDIQLRKNGKPNSLSLVGKSYVSSEFHEFIMNAYVLFQKEIEFYNDVVPLFADLEKRKGAQNLLDIFPKAYRALWDERNSLIILENLKTSGYKMEDRKNGLDLEHAKVAISALATFHALSYALKKESPTDYQKVIKAGREAQYLDDRRQFFGGMLPNVAKEALEIVQENASTAPYGEQVAKAFEQTFDKLQQFCCPPDNEPFTVLTHGDYWVNNMLFRYAKKDGQEVPIAAKIVDFQIARCASLATDINFFLYTSTTKQLRDKHFDDLLQTYCQRFTGCLRMLGSNPGSFTFFTLKREVKEKALFGFLVSSFMLRPILADVNAGEVPDLENMTKETFATSLPPCGKLYKDRMVDMVLEFVQKGYF